LVVANPRLIRNWRRWSRRSAPTEHTPTIMPCAASATQQPAVFASSWLALGRNGLEFPYGRPPDRLGRQGQRDGPPQRAWHGSGRAPRRRCARPA
jgi:hypothetical protein